MITKDLNVCLYPMKIVWDNIDYNLADLKRTLEHVHPQTDLLIIPETFSTGFPIGKEKETIVDMVSEKQDETFEQLKTLSNRHNLAIAGSCIYIDQQKLYNRAFFIEPNGDMTFADKRHLFTMAGEDKIFSCGNKRLKIRFRGWNITMVTCYDIRFPVWNRNVSNEYDILIAVANWPEVRITAWNKLLPARAIENEAYVCAVNCKGTDNKGFSYDGSSMILDFKGNEIGKEITVEEKLENSTTLALHYATLSRTKLDSFREKFPAYKDSDSFTINL